MSREKPPERAPKKGDGKAPSAWIPERPKRRGAAPAPLSEVLVGAQDYTSKRSGVAIPRAEWALIVGNRIASRTRVGSLRDGLLIVKVASSAWSNELSFLKQDLLRKINRAGHDVTELRFYVDKIENARPSARRAKAQATSIPTKTTLPPELLARLEKVEDENLRAAIAEAARRSLRSAPEKK